MLRDLNIHHRRLHRTCHLRRERSTGGYWKLVVVHHKRQHTLLQNPEHDRKIQEPYHSLLVLMFIIEEFLRNILQQKTALRCDHILQLVITHLRDLCHQSLNPNWIIQPKVPRTNHNHRHRLSFQNAPPSPAHAHNLAASTSPHTFPLWPKIKTESWVAQWNYRYCMRGSPLKGYVAWRSGRKRPTSGPKRTRRILIEKESQWGKRHTAGKTVAPSHARTTKY